MEWEQCKENIKPKQEGRNVSKIATTPKATFQTAQIQERQTRFEGEIKEYTGDDEMEVWVRYVRYMEDAYPEGDYLSNVGALQLRLIKRFQDEERYKQDPRLLRVFLDLAYYSPHATDVFSYCYHNKLVTGFSKFWVYWINSYIYLQKHDRAMKICEQAIKRFDKTTTFKGMRLQILRMIDAKSTENLENPVEELRKTGGHLFKDHSQNQIPGPLASKQNTNSGFSIFKDKVTADEDLPIRSTNPLETKEQCKENPQPKKQRWKHVVADTIAIPSSVEAFSVFEENMPQKQGEKFEKNTTALKAKKLPKPAVSDSTNRGAVPLLNPSSSQMVTTVAYLKSQVYPSTGEEWSFEELEAKRRWIAKNNSSGLNSSELSNSTTSSKRSRDSESSGEGETPDRKKYLSDADDDQITQNSNSLRSCLASVSAFGFDQTISSSTKKNILPVRDDDDGPVMAPDFKSASQMKERLSTSLNLSVRSESSIFKSDFKKPVEDSIRLASFKKSSDFESENKSIASESQAEACESDACEGEIDDNILMGGGGGELTLKGLQESMGIPEEKSEFEIFEDTVVGKGAFVKPPKFKGTFSKKKLKLHSPEKPKDLDQNSAPAFEIFSGDSGEAAVPAFDIFSEVKPSRKERFSFGNTNIDFDALNEGRPSDAFNIFSKTPEKSVEESYSLKKVAMTPLSCSTSNPTYVPCTVERLGTARTHTSDTRAIQKQAMNDLINCSRISEFDDTSSVPGKTPRSSVKNAPSVMSRVSYAPPSDLDKESLTDTTRVSEQAPGPEFSIFSDNQSPSSIPDKEDESKFSIFSDSLVLVASCPVPAQKDTEAFDIFSGNSSSTSIPPRNDKISNPMVIPFSKDVFEENRQQLTPILEGSIESDCSSLESVSNKSRALSTTAFDKTANKTLRDSTKFIIPTDSCERNDSLDTTPVLEGTAQIPGTQKVAHAPESSDTTHHPALSRHSSPPPRKRLVPDRTRRDLHLDASLLTRIPRTSLVPTEPVTDPWDQTFMERLMQTLDPPLFFKPRFNKHECNLRDGTDVKLGDISVEDITKIGEGAFAKVYSCTFKTEGHPDSQKAVKIQSPPAPWEFYILSELRQRMEADHTARDVLEMILPLSSIHVFKNSSVLVTSLFMEGSLLDMINHYMKKNMVVPGTVISTYTLDILRCIEAIHRADIIHGDIKPDNLLLRDKENTMTQSVSVHLTKSVVLIDFGRSIDMRILPTGSRFTAKSGTDLFECVEMQEGREWTFQVDYFGLLSCVHLMIHNEYMKVMKDGSDGLWRPTKRPHRRVDQELFMELYTDLLNVKGDPSSELITKYVGKFENYLKGIKFRQRLQELKDHYNLMSQSR